MQLIQDIRLCSAIYLSFFHVPKLIICKFSFLGRQATTFANKGIIETRDLTSKTFKLFHS